MLLSSLALGSKIQERIQLREIQLRLLALPALGIRQINAVVMRTVGIEIVIRLELLAIHLQGKKIGSGSRGYSV